MLQIPVFIFNVRDSCPEFNYCRRACLVYIDEKMSEAPIGVPTSQPSALATKSLQEVKLS